MQHEHELKERWIHTVVAISFSDCSLFIGYFYGIIQSINGHGDSAQGAMEAMGFVGFIYTCLCCVDNDGFIQFWPESYHLEGLTKAYYLWYNPYYILP